jgi:hypothetical protein
MGTRAIIKIQGEDSLRIYKHWDGYPEGLLPWLVAFNKKFTEKRGNDPTYKAAQLLRDSVRSAEEFNLDPSEFTGWGLTTAKRGEIFDMWQEYEYTLMLDGTVKVESVHFEYIDGKPSKRVNRDITQQSMKEITHEV